MTLKSKRRASAHQVAATNPVTLALVRQQITADIDRLRTAAGLHTHIGAGAGDVLNLVGRLTYIVCWAAGHHGHGQTPEARILAGTANALGDLAERHDTLEQQRDTLIAGLAAIDRLLPQLSTAALVAGAIELDYLLRQTDGMGTADVRRALEGGAA